MVAIGDLAGLVEVRDIGKFRPHPPLLADREMAARVHRAEPAGESELLVLGDLLIAEDEHGMAVHRRLDLADCRGGERRAQIDPVAAGGEKRVQRGEIEHRDEFMLPPRRVIALRAARQRRRAMMRRPGKAAVIAAACVSGSRSISTKR